MTFLINYNEDIGKTGSRVQTDLQQKIKKYYDQVFQLQDIDFIVLKSWVYFEEVIKDTNKSLFNIEELTPISKQLKTLEKFEDKRVEIAIKKFKALNKFRNNIAHSLSYTVENDPEFWEVVNGDMHSSLDEKKKSVALYLQEVATGLLLLYFGRRYFPNFIEYKNDNQEISD